MKQIVFLIFTMMLSFSAYAAETCVKCMARCPHLTRDIKDCDRGCPEVCEPKQAALIKKVELCKKCLNECPHQTRNLLPCDTGCKDDCDQEALFAIIKPTLDDGLCGVGSGTLLQHRGIETLMNNFEEGSRSGSQRAN
ncbi:MAG: hypothetical protein EOP11_19110 [Proteobacteria bacterium]|nr:MAG: hypothetical protein EOP11_19110 [Pseudomonadota bacterium]